MKENSDDDDDVSHDINPFSTFLKGYFDFLQVMIGIKPES